ncbi:inositol monophosphatase family protein [Microvirga rosea]|uniref:inositol monophosphatase family protein n=1 Tax=Microvirga rosea TaxID=2715425 RepID=UPI001D0B0985|nr:inositol monophosphatase family protein [Microvirga rosea]MCB8822240.1 inositol monophosphatase [Microvirga rosea]
MTDLRDSTRLHDVARRAALEVRDPLLAAFRTTIAVDYKVDLHDVVTEHDKRSEETITKFIMREVPDSMLLGEEGGSVGSGAVQWYVDPIDGTSNFARGLSFWCVSIAAVIEGEIVAGVVYDPVADNLFSADLNGAYLNGRSIRSNAVPDERRATLITGYPVARDFRLDGKQRALEDIGVLIETFSTVRRPGSAALSISHVAAGWVDAAVGFGVNPWDVTAAILILKQARGSYTPLTLGKVASSSKDYLCPGYVALGEGANYPTLNRIAENISQRRQETSASSSLSVARA